MPQFHPLPTAARDAHGLHRLQGQQDSRQRHDDAADNHVFDAMVDERPLLGETGEQNIPVSQVFRLGSARTENCRHNGRFYKQHSHDFSPPRLVVFVAQEEANHGLKSYTIGRSRFVQRKSQDAAKHGEHLVAPMAESFAQIADQSPRHGIGKHQSSDNSPLVLVIDPSDNSDIAIDPFDVGTGAKRVGDYDRFTQRNGFIIRHRSSQVGK